jgi:hypothetical protein
MQLLFEFVTKTCDLIGTPVTTLLTSNNFENQCGGQWLLTAGGKKRVITSTV